MSRSLTAIDNRQQVTQACLDQLINQPPALVVLPVNEQPPPPIAPVNNLPPPPVAPPQDPVTAWLRHDNNPVHQYHNSLYAPECLHGGYDPRDFGQYAESAAEPPKENEAINTLKEHVKALNQKVAEKVDDLADFQNLSLYPEARLPIGFKMQHIEKFSGNTPPHLHLRSYVRTMQLYGLKEEHLAQGFHQTLTGPAHKWFLGLERHRVADFCI